jgi:hypothetical protein
MFAEIEMIVQLLGACRRTTKNIDVVPTRTSPQVLVLVHVPPAFFHSLQKGIRKIDKRTPRALI